MGQVVAALLADVGQQGRSRRNRASYDRDGSPLSDQYGPAMGCPPQKRLRQSSDAAKKKSVNSDVDGLQARGDQRGDASRPTSTRPWTTRRARTRRTSARRVWSNSRRITRGRRRMPGPPAATKALSAQQEGQYQAGVCRARRNPTSCRATAMPFPETTRFIARRWGGTNLHVARTCNRPCTIARKAMIEETSANARGGRTEKTMLTRQGRAPTDRTETCTRFSRTRSMISTLAARRASPANAGDASAASSAIGVPPHQRSEPIREPRQRRWQGR